MRRKTGSKWLVHACVAMMLSVVMHSSSDAGVIFTTGNNPLTDEENVLFKAGETGALITGFTNKTEIPVDFSSKLDTLVQNAKGQAQIEAEDGLVINLTVTVPGGYFTGLIMNPKNGDGTGKVTVVANEPGGGTKIFPFEYDLGNGENFLTITTKDGETIASVTIDAVDGFEEFSQPRIVGAHVIPEPTSLALLGIGLVGMTGYGWRKRKQAAV